MEKGRVFWSLELINLEDSVSKPTNGPSTSMLSKEPSLDLNNINDRTRHVTEQVLRAQLKKIMYFLIANEMIQGEGAIINFKQKQLFYQNVVFNI